MRSEFRHLRLQISQDFASPERSIRLRMSDYYCKKINTNFKIKWFWAQHRITSYLYSNLAKVENHLNKLVCSQTNKKVLLIYKTSLGWDLKWIKQNVDSCRDNRQLSYPVSKFGRRIYIFFSFPDLYTVLQLKFRNHLWHGVIMQVAIAVVQL